MKGTPPADTPTGARDYEGVAARAPAPAPRWRQHLRKAAQRVPVLLLGGALFGISALLAGRFVNEAVDAKTFGKAAANAAVAGAATVTTVFTALGVTAVGVEMAVVGVEKLAVADSSVRD